MQNTQYPGTVHPSLGLYFTTKSQNLSKFLEIMKNPKSGVSTCSKTHKNSYKTGFFTNGS